MAKLRSQVSDQFGMPCHMPQNGEGLKILATQSVAVRVWPGCCGRQSAPVPSSVPWSGKRSREGQEHFVGSDATAPADRMGDRRLADPMEGRRRVRGVLLLRSAPSAIARHAVYGAHADTTSADPMFGSSALPASPGHRPELANPHLQTVEETSFGLQLPLHRVRCSVKLASR